MKTNERFAIVSSREHVTFLTDLVLSPLFTTTQRSVLLVGLTLAKRGGASTKEMIDILHVTKPTFEKALSELEEMGYIEVKEDEYDTTFVFREIKKTDTNVVAEREEPTQPARKVERFVPPTVEMVREYVFEKGYDDIDPEAFVLFYQSKGWKVGNTKMKNWKAAVGTWHKKRNQYANDRRNSQGERDAEFARHVTEKLSRSNIDYNAVDAF